MRHMELYSGEKAENWDIGLNGDPTKQMVYLRARFCRIILTCDINMQRLQNIAAAKARFNTSIEPHFNRYLQTVTKPF